MKQVNLIKTSIEGLAIKINKVVSDKRGVLCELAPNGANNPLLVDGIKNIYASIATTKRIPRAGHYHLKNIENFYVLSGTSLWLFRDYRKKSLTFNKNYFVIVGFGAPRQKTTVPSYTIDRNQMAQIFVPNGVYHVYWPITNKTVIVVAIASEPYDKNDYIYPKLDEIPNINKTLESFGIEV